MWAEPASANTGGTGGTGPTPHSFSFVPEEVTLDSVNDSAIVAVRIDDLPASVSANSVQVSVVHDDAVFSITGISCTGLYSGAFGGSARIASEGATSLICASTTAPTDTDLDGFIDGEVLQFTITRLQSSGDATLTLVSSGAWQTNVVESGTFVGTPILGSLSVPKNNANISGQVNYASSIDIGTFVPRVTLIDAGLQEVAATDLQPDGSFALSMIPIGTYTLRVELAGFQTAEAAGLVVSGPDIVMSAVTLEGGFVDSDDMVDGADLSILLAAFGPDPVVNRVDGSNNVIDINGDGISSILDIDEVISNFGTSRIKPWTVSP